MASMLEQGQELEQEATADAATVHHAALDVRTQEIQLQRDQLDIDAARVDLERRALELAAAERALAARRQGLQQQRAKQEAHLQQRRAHRDVRAAQLAAAIEAAVAAVEVAAAASSSAAAVWVPGLIRGIAAHMPPNEVLLTLRLVNRAAAHALDPSATGVAASATAASTTSLTGGVGRNSTPPAASVVRLSQPVPQHAFARQWGAAADAATRPCGTGSATSSGGAAAPASAAPAGTEASAMRRLPVNQRDRLLTATIRSGVAENVALLLDRQPDCFRLGRSHMRAAAIAGHVPMLALLHSRGCPMANTGIGLAAEEGRRGAVMWLLDNGYRPDMGVVEPGHYDLPADTPEEGAARGGHEALMEELLVRRAADRWPVSTRGLLLGWLALHAARHLPLGDLQRRWSQLVECMGGERFAAIAARGSGTCDSGYYDKPLELPEYFLFKALDAAACSETADWKAKVLWLVVDKRHSPLRVERLSCWGTPPRDRWEWLQQQGYDLGSHQALKAAAEGWVPELRLLVEGTGGQQQAGGGAAAAATAMHASRRIFDHSAASRTEVCVAAAEAGRLSCLEFLRGLQGWVGRGASDTERNMEVLQAAARSGSVPVLEWVLDVLMREASPPLSPLVATAAAGSGARGSVEVLAWLRRRGCQWNACTFAAAVGTRDVGLLEWLWAERCPRDGDMAYAAAVAAGQELDSDGQLGGVRRFGGGGSWCRSTVVRALTSDGVGVSSSSGGGGCGGGGASCGGAGAGAGGVSRVALLEWLHAHGVLPADAGTCFAAAAAVGDQTVLEWWAAKGWSLGGPGLAFGWAGGDLATLRTLHACGAPLAPHTFLHAVVHPSDYFPPEEMVMDEGGYMPDGDISYDDGPRTWGVAAVRWLAEEAGAEVDEEQALVRTAYRRVYQRDRCEVSTYVEALVSARRAAVAQAS